MDSVTAQKTKLKNPPNCLNCGTLLHGKFCHECGQESSEKILPMDESFSELLAEFLKFDAKLLTTIWNLLARPGFLTREFAEGKRVKYLQPIKLYLTVNFLLFLITNWLDPIMVKQKDLDAITEQLSFGQISANDFNQTFSSVIPPLLIFFIPLFAGLLKIIYIRSKHLFALHFIFTLHFFSFYMIAAIPGVAFKPFNYLSILIISLYLLLAIKKVYGQSWIKTLVKGVFMILSFFLLAFMWFITALFYTLLILVVFS